MGAATAASAGVNRWTTNGPAGVSVVSLAVDPTHPDWVYAGGEGGVFRSMDGGQSWTASLSQTWTTDLAIDPSSSSVVYATTYSGVFRSVDAGSSWAQVGPRSLAAFSVAVEPATPSSVYVGSADGLFKSNDRGASWSGKLLAASIYNLAFSAQTPPTVFGADWAYSFYYPEETSKLYKSADGGTTWSSTDTDIFITPGSLAVDPTNPTILYAGACGGEGADFKCDGVYKSFDAGSTWRQVSTSLVGSIHALVIDPGNPSTLYAGGPGVLFRSIDGGVTWSDFSTGLPDLSVVSVFSLAIDRTGTRLYAGTSEGGVFDYQIVPGPAALDPALDLSVGTDNRTRVLFLDLDNRAVFRSFDASGNSTSSGPYGPFDGWQPKAVADGPDGLTRVLWTNVYGTAELWLLGPTGIQADYRYGPAAGWTAVDVSVGSDGTTHLLWTSVDGRTGILSVAVSGAVVNRVTYGPYSGWLARSIANGADGLTRVLWTKHDGTVGLSLIDEGHLVAAFRFAGAPGWIARDVAVGSDNQTRILSVGADGRMAVWSVDNSGVVTNSRRVYGPVSGQVAARISAGADGLTRVLWTSPQGTGSLWLMDLDNVFQSSLGLGLD